MPSPSNPKPPHRSGPNWRPSVMVAALAVALVLLAWLSVAGVVLQQRRDALAADARQSRNLARSLSEQSLRVVASVDQALLRVAHARAAEQLSAADLVRFANETGLAPQILVQLSVINEHGIFQASNLDLFGKSTGRVDLSEREHVKAHLGHRERPADDDALFIGRPVLGKVSKRWTIQFSRALRDNSERMVGVAVASVDPSYFEAVFASVDVGSLGSVALLGKDLVVRARTVGGQPSGMGNQLSPDSPLAASHAPAEDHLQRKSSVDGIDRLLSYRRVADYPLFIIVSTAEAEALQEWRTARNSMLGLCALLSLVVMAAALAVISGLRRLEHSNEALKLSEAQAQAANQAKSEFIAAISHELRTPLTSIRGFAELMEHRLESPKFRETAGLIRKGAEHLNALLSEILDLAKVESGAMELQLEPVEIGPLVQGSVDFFALTAADKGLRLGCELAPDVPPFVQGDSLRLKQILNNLLSNALKFTTDGEVGIRLHREADWLLIDVVDTGPGIAADKQAQIFERFRQGDARVSYQHGGTGLGLALSRALAELMGGTLTVQSELGHGACFTLRLPVRQPASAGSEAATN